MKSIAHRYTISQTELICGYLRDEAWWPLLKAIWKMRFSRALNAGEMA
jgi:hypothetical protein